MMTMVYRIVIDFETREDAEACQDLITRWEMQDLEIYIPPENAFATYPIEERGE
jgi:hypothetical protein